MSDRFDPRRGLVRVDAQLHGPGGTIGARLMLDTGSFLTMLRPSFLERLGCDVAALRTTVLIAGITGSARAPLYLLDGLSAVGQEQTGVAVIGYAFSGSFPFDGLLGANFLRGRRLTVDYRSGTVRLD